MFFILAFLVLLMGRWLRPVGDLVLTVAAPFEAVIDGAATAVGDVISGVVEGPGLRSENERLRRDNARLLHSLVLLQGYKHENQLLRRMAGYHDANGQLDLLPAQVIGNDPNNLAPYIIINKGRRDGLRPGMTVVDPGGYFVGSIERLTNNAARVLLMISPSSSVGALDRETRAKGVVEGQFGGRPQLKFVVTRSTLHVRDFIVTSGQMSLYPQNVILGQVVRVQHSDVSLFQTADIQPAADFQNLELVQVVRNFVPNAPTRLTIGQ
ncbi:MAG: rod shape-determining protein MreC [Chloroflexi bacterium]|nr:rod shape-determining protein MreC [Chloroflexota bacterium]